MWRRNEMPEKKAYTWLITSEYSYFVRETYEFFTYDLVQL